MTMTANRRWLLVATTPILLGLVQVVPAPADEQGGMVLIAACRATVGTSEAERKELAERFDCHPTWLGDDLGEDPRWALLAVVSRDGRRVITTGRVGEGAGFSVATNTLFTCLHTDSLCRVPPQRQTTTRQLFWFLDGTLGDLQNHFRRDFDNDEE